MRFLVLAFAAALGLTACATQPPPVAEVTQRVHDQALRAAVGGTWRSAEPRARDAYRHPYESLDFWGLRPGMTVVEIDPGGEAWWSEILAPYARQTGGRYIAGYADLSA